jgi:SSS family solute:Na+ symporter/cation/acetate symporter
MFDMSSSMLVALVLTVFVTVCLFMCVIAGPDRDDPKEFYAANRTLSARRNGLAITGAYISTLTVLSTTGAIALSGLDGLVLAATEVLALAVLGATCARALRKSNGYTLGDTLTTRLPHRSVRLAVGIATLTVCLPYLVLQLDATARVMTYLLGLTHVAGAATACIVVTGLLMMTYATLGGMPGTGLIQVVKAFALLSTTALLAVWVLWRFHGDLPHLVRTAADASGLGDGYLQPGHEYGQGGTAAWDSVSLQLTVVCCAAGLPQVTMRLATAPSPGSARSAMRIATWLTAVFCLLAAVTGLGVSAIVGDARVLGIDPTGADGILVLARELDSSGGLLAALACVIFVTALATVAGVTLAAAATVARDLVGSAPGRGNVGPRAEIRTARWAAVVVGAVAITAAIPARAWNLQLLTVTALTTAASALTPTLVYALFWRRFNRSGALWTLYGGTAVTLVLVALSPQLSGTATSAFPSAHFDWLPLAVPGVISIPTGFALGALGTLLTVAGADEAPRLRRIEPGGSSARTRSR